MNTFENKNFFSRFFHLPAWKKDKPQVVLSEVAQKKKMDWVAALAKALLVFMISYGSVAGFLNAYAMEFNQVLCAAGILGLALLMAFIYETGRKWFTNLCVIGIFIVYAYVAVSRFWVLNSGAYAVINKMYEEAQIYLGVVGGGLYSLRVEDAYLTVTSIALFVGAVLDILLVIRLQYKASLVRTVLMTFTLYLVPIYFERTPDLLSLFLLLSGYVTMGILQCGKVKKHISGQIRQALPIGVAVAAVICLFFGVLLPKNRYRAMVPKNVAKAETEESAMALAQYGVTALFMNHRAGGGISQGRLSQNMMFMPDNETDLIVRFTPYGIGPTYLKAFTGLDYNGREWNKATDVLGPREDQMEATSAGRRELYDENPEIQSRGVMEVINVDAQPLYEYRPYYTDLDEIQPLAGDGMSGHRGMRYAYYPVVSNVDVPGGDQEPVSDRYLEVPAICRNAVEAACREAGLTGTPEEIADQVVRYFAENYTYTLRPGYYFGGMDYISYFLARNKKGFCAHFASAGTMLFRAMGIPARYVEGYVFSYTDVVTDGELLMDAAYEDYYDGYSPLGETALVEVEIPDANGHAWVEIYVKDKGWVVVDPTPAATNEEEETGSFWDSILGSGLQAGNENQEEGLVGAYLENALAGSAGLLGIVVLCVIALFLGRWGMQSYRESKLPGRERVQLEYGRLTGWLKERDEEFRTLTTPKEEFSWVRDHYGIDFPEALQEELYRTFFAPEEKRDYEALRIRIREARKKVRHAKKI